MVDATVVQHASTIYGIRSASDSFWLDKACHSSNAVLELPPPQQRHCREEQKLKPALTQLHTSTTNTTNSNNSNIQQQQ
jgi:hypothetical protein